MNFVLYDRSALFCIADIAFRPEHWMSFTLWQDFRNDNNHLCAVRNF